jgi:hypothetical protein
VHLLGRRPLNMAPNCICPRDLDSQRPSAFEEAPMVASRSTVAERSSTNSKTQHGGSSRSFPSGRAFTDGLSEPCACALQLWK